MIFLGWWSRFGRYESTCCPWMEPHSVAALDKNNLGEDAKLHSTGWTPKVQKTPKYCLHAVQKPLTCFVDFVSGHRYSGPKYEEMYWYWWPPSAGLHFSDLCIAQIQPNHRKTAWRKTHSYIAKFRPTELLYAKSVSWGFNMVILHGRNRSWLWLKSCFTTSCNPDLEWPCCHTCLLRVRRQ